MNVFKKISSSNIFTTEKKRTSVKPPQSALKVDIKHQDCYFLVDYELRGDQLLVCRIAKDSRTAKSAGSKGHGVKNCMVKEKIEMKHLWVGKEYCLVNLSSLIKDSSTNEENSLEGIDFVADKMFDVEKVKKQSIK